jgi:Pentapeptide repeats (8 copies)
VANRQHLSMLKQGVAAWNQWRKENPDVRPELHEAALAGMNLSRADLTSANLNEANLSGADLREANLSGASLNDANLHEANLHKADLGFADLTFADLSKADLTSARLWKADLTAAKCAGANFATANLSITTLRETDLSTANLNGAELNYAILVETNLKEANLTGCSIYGISIWDVHLQGAIQANLVITLPNEPIITVDSLEIAQFLYLLLHNEKVREVINTINSNIVLILGRFTPERKPALEAIRDELRKQHYLPVLFDFERPLSRDFSVMVSTLAHIARFIIADLTYHKSIARELQTFVPHIAVPVQPLLSSSKNVYSMFPEFKKYPWVLPGYRYKNLSDLVASLEARIIKPAEQKAAELGRH